MRGASHPECVHPECADLLVPQRAWNEETPEGRAEMRASGYAKNGGRGLCKRHYVAVTRPARNLPGRLRALAAEWEQRGPEAQRCAEEVLAAIPSPYTRTVKT